MYTSVQLSVFTQAHPPHPSNIRPGAEWLERYASLVPQALLELWQTHGLGYYGELRLWLVDPAPWELVLNKWLSNSDDGVQRIPFLMTPLGILLYYRQDDTGEETVSAIDIFERDVWVVAENFVEFFNTALTEAYWLDELIPPEDLERAKARAGQLEPGQIYTLDQTLKDVVTLYAREEALSVFETQFEIAQTASNFDYPSPGVLSEALPEPFNTHFQAASEVIGALAGSTLPGFYLSACFCRYYLLVLMPDHRCQLLFWTTHPLNMKSNPPRLYEGTWWQQLTDDGDTRVTLDLEKDALVDREIAPDQQFYWVPGDAAMLIRDEDLEYVAGALEWKGSVEHPQYPMRKVAFDHWIPKDVENQPVPPLEAFPVALRRLLRSEPLRVVITQVGEFDEESESLTVRARIEGNKGRPPLKNMPLCSPEGASKQLLGWVWEIGDTEVELGMSVHDASDLHSPRWPCVGNVMISRQAKRVD